MRKIDRRTAKRWLWGIAICMLLMPVIPITIFLVQVGGVSERHELVQLVSEIETFYRVSRVSAITGVLLMLSLVFARMLGWTAPKRRAEA